MFNCRVSFAVIACMWLIFSTIHGQLTEICQDLSQSECNSNDQCEYLSGSSVCICVEDDKNIDIWFLFESAQISQQTWNRLMTQLASDYVEYIQSDKSNVYLLRFGDNTVEMLENTTQDSIENWEYKNYDISSTCDALDKTEEYLKTMSNGRNSIVVTIFGNSIEDGPCSTDSLSGSVVYGVLDESLAESDEFSFFSFDGQCSLDFSQTAGLAYMEKYILSVISDYACEMQDSTTNAPVMQPTANPTNLYVPYVNYVYKKYKPEKIHLIPRYHDSSSSSSSKGSSSSSSSSPADLLW